MPFYPPKISSRSLAPANVYETGDTDATGTEVDFTCGVSVKFFLEVDSETKIIKSSRFRTNGCGYVIATAELFSDWVAGRNLGKLNALSGLAAAVSMEFGDIPKDRTHCIELCRHALENAFAEYRKLMIAEWNGEKVLICTCFGVEEEIIEELVAGQKLETVESVGERCRAGTGCGSCQPLIQEILDSAGYQ